MKIHLLGHASLLVETQDCKILIDPVLEDPFCEGLNASCPQREIAKEQLPKYDFLVISHRHLDHFDLKSLAYLPKDVDVLIPQDNLIESSLRQLGYERVYPLGEFVKVRADSTLMMTTRSEIRVPEFGLVIADNSGVFWNTVDTYFAPNTINKVREQFPEIDFLLTTWHISMEGKYQYNQSLNFPGELYQYLFKLIELIQPKAIAPGAQGFKYIGNAAWQNQTVFPITRERFCHDLKLMFPQLQDNIFAFNPGDIIELNRDDCIKLSAASPYATMTTDNRECVDFAPVIAGNPLVDNNPENYDLAVVKQTIKSELNKLPQFIAGNRQLFDHHYQMQIIYQLEIVDPQATQKYWIDFSQAEVTIKRGRNPLANLFTYITASSLYSLIAKIRDWDYLLCSGEYRTFNKVYAVSSTGINYSQIAIDDPVNIIFSSEYIANHNIYRELPKFEPKNLVKSNTASSMVNLGNILIRTKPKSKPEASIGAETNPH